MVKQLKCNIKALALSLGITYGFAMFLLGIMSIFGWGVQIVNIMGSMYIGYKPTFFGAVLGGVYAFIDGAIGGALIAWLYNKFAK